MIAAVNAAAVVYVQNLQPMSRFYRDCFGLEVTESTEDYCTLTSTAWTVSLVVIPDTVAATIAVTSPPRRRVETPVKLALEVPGIEALRLRMESLGGRLDPGETAWELHGVTHCDGVDPEGNVVQVLQTAATTS